MARDFLDQAWPFLSGVSHLLGHTSCPQSSLLSIMSFQQSQKSRHHPCKIQKRRLTQDQVRVLEASFNAGKKLEPERKFQLARELGVPPRQIAIWYQNKRARWKNQSLELDYGALQLRLEAALADKRQLEKQVESLRAELKRATQDATGAFSFRAQFQNPVFGSSLSSGCDEATITVCSSLNNDVRYTGNWGGYGDSLKFEDLYSCLMLGTPKGSNHAPFSGGV